MSRAQHGGERRQVARVRRVGLRPAQPGLGEVVRLARVDGGDAVARLAQGDGERHLVVPGRLQHDEGLAGRLASGLRATRQGGEARRGLLAGERRH
jgi:hypothetical protein